MRSVGSTGHWILDWDQRTVFCCCYSVTKLCSAILQPHGPCIPAFPVLHCLPEFAPPDVHWVSDAISPSPLPPLFLPSTVPSIRIFSNESDLHIRWPKDWSFSFSISPSSEYSGAISFRMGCLDLLGVQGTLKSLLQHLSLKNHQFLGVQPS